MVPCPKTLCIQSGWGVAPSDLIFFGWKTPGYEPFLESLVANDSSCLTFRSFIVGSQFHSCVSCCCISSTQLQAQPGQRRSLTHLFCRPGTKGHTARCFLSWFYHPLTGFEKSDDGKPSLVFCGYWGSCHDSGSWLQIWVRTLEACQSTSLRC